MTRLRKPTPGPDSDKALLGSEAADYARYRPGLPNATIHLPATAQNGAPEPVLLDLGTSTEHVLPARHPGGDT